MSKTKPFWDPIQNNNLKLFGFKSTSASSKKSSTITILKKNNKLFHQLLLNANSRGGNTGDFFSCEPFEYPPSLSINGSLRFGNKSDITKIILQHQTSTQQTCPSFTSMKVFDAAAKIKSLRIPDSVKTFKDYKMYFYSHIKSQTSNIARFDLIFDCYINNSLKSTARAIRGLSTSIQFRFDTS